MTVRRIAWSAGAGHRATLLLALWTACAEAPGRTALEQTSAEQDNDLRPDAAASGPSADEPSLVSEPAAEGAAAERETAAAKQPRDVDASIRPGNAPEASSRLSLDGALSSARDGAVDKAAHGDRGLTSETMGDGASDGASDAPQCQLAASQVAILGDSYLLGDGPVVRFLHERASAVGTLQADESYLVHAQAGASMASSDPLIPAQLTTVLLEAALRGSAGVKLAIVNGGGNDFLVDNRICLELSDPASNPLCGLTMERTVRTVAALFKDMARAGVEHVIYVGYPDLPGGGLGGTYPSAINDYATPKMRAACESETALVCHYVDPRDAFAGHPEYIGALDRVLPTDEGGRVLAELIWPVLTQACVGTR